MAIENAQLMPECCPQHLRMEYQEGKTNKQTKTSREAEHGMKWNGNGIKLSQTQANGSGIPSLGGNMGINWCSQP